MNPKNFLLWGGMVLVLVALLGFFGVIGPDSGDSVFGESWYFDNAENWAHLVIGVVALLLLAASASVQKPVVMIVGIIALLVGLYSLFAEGDFLGANLENPADTILHIVVGLWAILSARGSSEMSSGSMPGTTM